MLLELNTFTLKTGALATFEDLFASGVQPARARNCQLRGAWRTEIGPLNQVVLLWSHADWQAYGRDRDELDTHLAKASPAGWEDIIHGEDSVVMKPAPFMRSLASRQFGSDNIYEMRTYTYNAIGVARSIERWAEKIEAREKYSPLVACMYSMSGRLHQFVTVWVYKDFADKARVRAAVKQEPNWPPRAKQWMVHQENKYMIPLSFSPLL